MNVFDKYSFIITDRVKFKDTKRYLGDMLKECFGPTPEWYAYD